MSMVRSEVVPRVLFVTPLAFNHFTGGGVTFSNLFRGWPKDRLFTVHADQMPVTTDTCVHYYALSSDELPLAGPLQRLRSLLGRGGAAEPAAPGPAFDGPAVGSVPRVGIAKKLALKAANVVFGNSGLPVSARLSARLIDWIEQAKPDVLYTILGSIEMMELVEKIRRRFDIPVVVHLMDDWRAERERYGLLSPLRRRRLHALFNRSMRMASAHLAISDAMAKTYGAEFGVPFVSIQNVIDSDRWLSAGRRKVAAGRPAQLLYAGSLYAEVQLEALLEIAASVARLRRQGAALDLNVMAPDFMIEPFRRRLEAHDGTRIVDQVPRERYFERLCEADVLLLPANFSDAAVRMVRYSMPTKVPEFLVSGVPILLYAPADIAQVDYARQAGWGLAVTERAPAVLDAAIARIVGDDAVRQRLVDAGRATAASRHDASEVRALFRETLRKAGRSRVESNKRSCEVA